MRRLGYVYLVSTCLGVAYGSRPSAASLSLSHDEVSGDNDTQHRKQNLVDLKDQDELENQSKDEEGSPNKDADHRITQRLWQILEKHKHVLMDLQKHPDCLQVLVMGMKTNDTESDFQLTGLIHEMKSHRECTPVVMEVLVRGAGQPFWLSELFNVHPESVLIFEAFVISVLTYMIVAHLIRFFANHIAMNVKDPLACVNDPVPGPPSPVSWIVDICSHCLPCLRRVPGLDGVSTDPGSSGENLKESWKPLEGAQLKQLRSVMNKSRTLQVAGIAEQRVSGTWKLIEMAAAALTPIGNRRHSAVLCDHSMPSGTQKSFLGAAGLSRSFAAPGLCILVADGGVRTGSR
ncbi:unnamed protein product [Durusdinium trenchii]|uniref:Uncharacterized protein n=1 Tax=Durusdinium trenchii TaxID=1381693 RepID=A0ABP0QWF9_9DINO